MARVWYSLYDRLLHDTALRAAFRKVKSANGAPGKDGVSCKDFAGELEVNIAALLRDLRSKSYIPEPVLRVEIDKPGGGKRLLGIPTVRDRVVQQALKTILEPIFDPDFHPSSYGYRKGRSPGDAVAKSAAFMRKYNLQDVVDMDLSKCFDTLSHELILKSVRRKVSDGSVLRLIRMFLECGVMEGTHFEETEIGSPQGGVISPLLANIYLDAFDQFMKERGHRIVRYADDILIFKGSRGGAENALKVATGFLEGKLKLKVNKEKTHITSLREGVKFLGVTIFSKRISVQEKKLKAFKDKIRKVTGRNSPGPLQAVIKKLNPVLRGFMNYFSMANCKKVMQDIMAWVRRRLRAIQMKLWKKPQRLHRRLRQLGHTGDFKRIKMASWRNARSPLSHLAIPNTHFDELDLFQCDKAPTGQLPSVTRG